MPAMNAIVVSAKAWVEEPTTRLRHRVATTSNPSEIAPENAVTRQPVAATPTPIGRDWLPKAAGPPCGDAGTRAGRLVLPHKIAASPVARLTEAVSWKVAG